MSERSFVDFITSHKSLIIVPDTALDSLLAAGILLKSLVEHGWDARISMDAKVLVDYPNDPAILVNLVPIVKERQISVESNPEKGSSAALIVHLLDTLFGVDTWSKLLAVASGFYRNYYNFKQGGFKGVETALQNDLIQSKNLSEAPALRLWGAKRKGLVAALTRTFMPILPGITGVPDKAVKIVEEVFKGTNPYTVKQKEIKGDDISRALLKSVVDTIHDPSIAMMIVGDFYVVIQELSEHGEIEMSELVGSMTVVESLCRECPYDVIAVSLDKTRISQVLSIYDEVAEDVAELVSSCFSLAKTGEPVELTDPIERPDIIVDTLMYINALPRDKPVKALINGRASTVLRELLRTGVKPDKAYSACEADQLCYQQ